MSNVPCKTCMVFGGYQDGDEVKKCRHCRGTGLEPMPSCARCEMLHADDPQTIARYCLAVSRVEFDDQLKVKSINYFSPPEMMFVAERDGDNGIRIKSHVTPERAAEIADMLTTIASTQAAIRDAAERGEGE